MQKGRHPNYKVKLGKGRHLILNYIILISISINLRERLGYCKRAMKTGWYRQWRAIG